MDIFSFIKQTVGRAVEKWVLGKVTVLLVSLGLMVVLWFTLRYYASSRKVYQSKLLAPADNPSHV